MTDRNSPTVAITGANGFLGSTLCKHFSDLGWNVIALVRNPTQNNPDKIQETARITHREYDITKPLTDGTLQGVDYLIHAAFVKYDKQHPDALQINLDGAKRLVEAADTQNLKKLIFISSMSAHGEATSVYGKQKLEIVKVFTGKNKVVLRSGLILGNGGIVLQMSQFMRSKHAVPLIAGGKQPLQTIAVYDLAYICERALLPGLDGTFVVATPRVYSYREFYEALAKRLRIKVVFVPIPYSLLLLAFKTIAILHIPLGVGEDNLRGLQQLRSMETAKDLQTLGVTIDPLDVALQKVQL